MNKLQSASVVLNAPALSNPLINVFNLWKITFKFEVAGTRGTGETESPSRLFGTAVDPITEDLNGNI